MHWEPSFMNFARTPYSLDDGCADGSDQKRDALCPAYGVLVCRLANSMGPSLAIGRCVYEQPPGTVWFRIGKREAGAHRGMGCSWPRDARS